MADPEPHIKLLYDEALPEAVFDDFVETVNAQGLSVELRTRSGGGVFASPEWLIPTAVMIFITQGYFNGFLGEMGKDHYALLKKALKDLRERFSYIKVTLIGSPGKVSKTQPYSLAYSIYFASLDGKMVKFLVPAGEGPDEEIDRTMDVFADFLADFYAGALAPEHAAMLAQASTYGGTMLVALNSETGRIEPIHPATHAFGLKPPTTGP